LTSYLRSRKRGVRFEGNSPRYCAFWDTELLVKLTDARLVGSPWQHTALNRIERCHES